MFMEEKMKDSGIKWIGKIPEDWTVKRLKYCVNKFGGGGTPESSNDEFYDDEHGVNWVAIGDMSTNQYVESTDRKVTELGIKDQQLTIYPKGTVIYSIYATIGKVAELKASSTINQALIAIIENKEILNKNYLKKYLNFLENIVLAETSTNTQANLNLQKVQNFMICLPPLIEQQRIAEFLDKKCADIDEIIAKTEKQIKTLEQYKKSIITEAVTKGFDNNLEYINNTFYKVKPQNWKLSRIKDVLSLLTDYTANGSFQSLADNVEYLDYEAYARVIRLTDLRVNMENAGIYVNEHAYNYLRKSSLFGGEILVANVGAYAGIFCEMPKCKYKATLGPNMFLLKTNKLMLQHYLYYIGLSYIVSKQLIIKATASAQPKLNKQDVKTIYILVPPISEQKEIIEFLDNRCEEIDQIIYKQKEGLKILKKYKQSLIYEYVTGKKRV